MSVCALFKLAWHLLKRSLGRVFGVKTGLESFLGHYAKLDRLPPTSPEESSILRSLSRCNVCKKCDEAISAKITPPSDLIIRYTRIPGHYHALQKALVEYHDTELQQCSSACPQQINFLNLRKLVESTHHG